MSWSFLDKLRIKDYWRLDDNGFLFFAFTLHGTSEKSLPLQMCQISVTSRTILLLLRTCEIYVKRPNNTAAPFQQYPCLTIKNETAHNTASQTIKIVSFLTEVNLTMRVVPLADLIQQKTLLFIFSRTCSQNRHEH